MVEVLWVLASFTEFIGYQVSEDHAASSSIAGKTSNLASILLLFRNFGFLSTINSKLEDDTCP